LSSFKTVLKVSVFHFKSEGQHPQ